MPTPTPTPSPASGASLFSAAQVPTHIVWNDLSQSVVSSITVMSFKGVDTTGTNGSGAIGATGTGNALRYFLKELRGGPLARLVLFLEAGFFATNR
jgi:hypothetical protein